MKKGLLFMIASLFLLASCRQEGDLFSFSLSSVSVVEGEDLPVSLAITSGSYDGYQVAAKISLYDVTSGTEFATDYRLYADGAPVGGGEMDFVDHGRKDFYVPGVEAGTYMIAVTLTKGGQSSTASVVTVVQQKEEPIDPPGPPPGPTEVYVSSITVPGITLVEGKLQMKIGEKGSYVVVWSPENANMLDFQAGSTNEAVFVAAIANGILDVTAIGAGEATLSVTAPGGAKYSAVVAVQPNVIPVDGVTVPDLPLVDGVLPLQDGDVVRYPLSWTPANATEVSFAAASSDAEIVEASVEGSTLVVKAKYPGDAVVTVSCGDGVSVSFPVRVHKDVVVTIEWHELDPTDAQLATKTFPCQLKFSSDSDKPFPTPIVWTVTMKGVVNVSGKDTQSVVVKKEIYFEGDRPQYFDVSSELLVPCYLLYRTTEFTLSITMTLQRYEALDEDYWGVTYNEIFRTQESRIGTYITEIQQ